MTTKAASSRLSLILAITTLAMPLSPSQAPNGTSQLIGTWKVIAAVSEEIPSGNKTDVYGPDPSGYLMYGADGRMMALIVRGNRKKPMGAVPTMSEAETLFRGMLSYTGTYTVKGNEVIHHVDASWNEAWTGTDQMRLFNLEGTRLTISTEQSSDPFNGKVSVRRLVFEKVK